MESNERKQPNSFYVYTYMASKADSDLHRKSNSVDKHDKLGSTTVWLIHYIALLRPSSIETSSVSRTGSTISNKLLHTATVGSEPNRGPPSASAASRLQNHAGVVHQGEEDEGHLPHTEPVQHRRREMRLWCEQPDCCSPEDCRFATCPPPVCLRRYMEVTVFTF